MISHVSPPKFKPIAPPHWRLRIRVASQPSLRLDGASRASALPFCLDYEATARPSPEFHVGARQRAGCALPRPTNWLTR